VAEPVLLVIMFILCVFIGDEMDLRVVVDKLSRSVGQSVLCP
jgi:hypothetical protein